MGALCSRGDGRAPAGGSPPSAATAPAARAWSQSPSPAPLARDRPQPPPPPQRARGPQWPAALEAAESEELAQVRAAALATEWRAASGAPNAFLKPVLERQARDAQLLERLTAMDESWKRHLDVVRERHSRLRGIDEHTFQGLLTRLEQTGLTSKAQSSNPETAAGSCPDGSRSLPSPPLERRASGPACPPRASTKTQQ